MSTPLVEFRDVDVVYQKRGQPPAHILKSVSMTIARGETLGLVGESGAGKSTIGKCVLGVAPVVSGDVLFDGKSLLGLDRHQRRALTAEIQTVFQDPIGSLNPMRTIGQSLSDPLVAHGHRNRAEINQRIAGKLADVGLDADVMGRMPAQFSGGQLQRIVIARALMLDPQLLILDEPVSALDLSVQGQVLNLLKRLQDTRKLSYLFITHDLAVVRHLAQNLAVIEAGRIVEQGPTGPISTNPKHPYTKRLLDAVLLPDPALQRARHQENGERL